MRDREPRRDEEGDEDGMGVEREAVMREIESSETQGAIARAMELSAVCEGETERGR